MDRLLLRIHNETVLRDLEEGDLVEFPREFFSHWGIYVGEEQIVHVVKGGFSSCGSSFSCENCSTNERGRVSIDNFWSVVQDSKAKKNNRYDKILKPLPKEEIKRRAIKNIGYYTYNFVLRNCEHFASWCRYDKFRSRQVDKGLDIATKAGAIAVIVLSLINAIRIIQKKLTRNEMNI